MNNHELEKLKLTMEGRILLDLLKDLGTERSKITGINTRIDEIIHRLNKLEKQDAQNK